MMLLPSAFFADSRGSFYLAKASERPNEVFIPRVWSDAFEQKFGRFGLPEFLSRYKQTRATEGLLALIGTLACLPVSPLRIDSLAIFRGQAHHAEMLFKQAGIWNVKSLLRQGRVMGINQLHGGNHEILVSRAFGIGSEFQLYLARPSGTANKVFIFEIWSPGFPRQLERYDLQEFLSRYDYPNDLAEGLLAVIGTLALSPASSFGIDANC
jgi:hypothetical protein